MNFSFVGLITTKLYIYSYTHLWKVMNFAFVGLITTKSYIYSYTLFKWKYIFMFS